MLGGGRETKDSEIDLAVGIEIMKKKGDFVEEGEPLVILHANDLKKAEIASNKVLSAYHFSIEKPEPCQLIKCILD